MSVEIGLNLVTLIMCIVTLTMATAALLPQIKQGLVILRDGLLWAVLFGFLGLVGVIGWSRLLEIQTDRSDAEANSLVEAAGLASPEPRLRLKEILGIQDASVSTDLIGRDPILEFSVPAGTVEGNAPPQDGATHAEDTPHAEDAPHQQPVSTDLVPVHRYNASMH